MLIFLIHWRFYEEPDWLDNPIAREPLRNRSEAA